MTQDQDKVAVVLRALGFKMESTMPGAEPKFEINSAVIESLASQKGKKVVVASDGKARIE